MHISEQNKRIVIGLLVFVFVFQFVVVTAFLKPEPAYAQGAPDVVAVLQAQAIENKIKMTRTTLLKLSLYQALLNAFTFFVQRLAYDTAVWMVTGDSGQKPLLFTKQWGTYLGDVGANAIAEFSDALDIPGLDFCNPDLALVLRIQLGIRAQSKRPESRCSWNQISGNYQAFFSQEGLNKTLSQSGLQLEPGQSALSVGLRVNRYAFTEYNNKVNEAINKRAEEAPFKGVVDTITGKIETPSAVVKSNFDQQFKKTDNVNEMAMAGAFFNLDVGGAILQTAVSTFMNTALSMYLERVMGGFFALGGSDDDGIFNPQFAQSGSRRRAQQVFSELLTANIRSVESYNMLSDFTVCPENRGPMNCVMNEQFAAAVRQATAGRAMTVQEAIDQKLLNGDWPLISSQSVGFNQDQYCYTYGYCYSNLVKLRRARILPIGWELAAKISPPGAPISLNDAISKFNECDENGEANETFPYCHLIDPDWVLKYPVTQCRQYVSGPTLIDAEGNRRADVCVDAPSCNAEDDNGNCIGGWGYCTREKNVWRFDGDECPSYFATCQSFVGSQKQELFARTNTVDYGICNTDNAGCRWYSTAPDSTDPDTAWDEDARIYLNSQAAMCDEGGAGCTELVPRKEGVTLNLVRNPSFENDTLDPLNNPDHWEQTSGEYGQSVDAAHGKDAVRLAGSARITQRITVSPNRFYTMSFHAKQQDVSGAANLEVDIKTATGGDVSMASYFVGAECTKTGSRVKTSLVTSDIYERQTCTFTTPNNAAYLYLSVFSDASQNNWFDAIQLEESEFVTNFTEGYGGPGASRRAWLKTPPAGFCDGGEDDPDFCDAYAKRCEPTEVGCTLYTPLSGDPEIPGIARASDQCPAACVGYQTFFEEETNFDLAENNLPYYFIPDTADACSATNAGCDEFTNMSTGATAENREYYTFLRLCEPTEVPDDSAAYYTWEGTEESGFQLRVWNLKRSDVDSVPSDVDPDGGIAPCTSYNAQNNTCRDAIEYTPPESCNGSVDVFLNPDCREFYDEAGNIHYRLFSKTVIKTNDCTDFRKTNSTQLDCQGTGGRWEAPTGQCFYKAYVPGSNSCPASENMCRMYTGNAGRNVEIVFEDDFEDGDTTGWVGGVISSESLAATGQSMRKASATSAVSIEIDTARDKTYLLSFWARGTANLPMNVAFTNAPVDAEHSFSINDNNPATPTAVLTSDWRYYELGPITVDWNYPDDGELIFIAAGELYLDNIRLKAVTNTIGVIRNSWNTPAACDATQEGAYSAQEMLGCEAYRDVARNQVYLKSFSRLCGEDAVGCEAFFDTYNSVSPYAETWDFICIRPDLGSGPCSVDPDGSGAAPIRQVCVIAPGRDRCAFHWDNEILDPNPSNISPSPISLPYIDGTTDMPRVRAFFYGPDLAVVHADSSVYLVNDPNKSCAIDEKGCAKMGVPSFNQALTDVLPGAWESIYKFNSPDSYDDELCSDQALFCDAWQADGGSTHYFKDPINKTCTYRPPGKTEDPFGWFQTGTTTPCDSDFQISGEEYGIWTNQSVCALSDTCASGSGCNCPAGSETPQCIVRDGAQTCTPYQGWAGACEPQFSGCTEFRDPVDIVRGAQKAYTFIDNERLDPQYNAVQERCDDGASLEGGCVMFNDISDPELTWNAGATYLKSEENNGALASPVDCENSLSPDAQEYCHVCTLISIVGSTPRSMYCTQSTCDSMSGGVFIRGSCSDVTTNDSNLVLNVRRDRECSEWLACDQSEEVWNPRTNQREVVCSSLKLCDGKGDTGSDLTSCIPVADEESPEVLSATKYSSRRTDWYGEEYSGYSIPDLYPVDSLKAVNMGACVSRSSSYGRAGTVGIPGPGIEDILNDPDKVCIDTEDCESGETCVSHYRLGHVIGPCALSQGAECYQRECSISHRPCATSVNCGTSGGICENVSSNTGRCYSGECVQTPLGNGVPLSQESSSSMCRIYPEAASPFPNEVVADSGWGTPYGEPGEGQPGYTPYLDLALAVRQEFQNAELCASGEPCECTYKKVSFEGGETRYYGQGTTGPDGICTDGRVGADCSNDSECDIINEDDDEIETSGTCSFKLRADTFMGMSGFCLEKDLSLNINANEDQYACLTWFPVDRIAGAPDMFNQFAGAGFTPTSGNEWYCAEGQENLMEEYVVGIRTEGLRGPKIILSYWDDPDILKEVFGPAAREFREGRGPRECGEEISDFDCVMPSIEHRGRQDCEDGSDSGDGAWCLWPQRECDDRDGWGDDGYCQNQFRDGEGGSGPNNIAGDGNPNGINFFGCYEVADHARMSDTEIRYPWIGDDIYKYQVERFEIQMGRPWDFDANGIAPGVTTCQSYTNEPAYSDSEFGGDNFLFGVTNNNPSEPMDNDSDADISIRALWRADNRLGGFAIRADDDHDEVVFFIESLTIHFWPSCFQVAKAGEASAAKAYTDRVVLGNHEMSGYASTDQCTQWGAICAPTANALVVSNPEVSGTEGTTDSLYTAPMLLKQLFARSNDVFTLERPDPISITACDGGAFQDRACLFDDRCRYDGECRRVCLSGDNRGEACSSDEDCGGVEELKAGCSSTTNKFCTGDEFPIDDLSCTSDSECRNTTATCTGSTEVFALLDPLEIVYSEDIDAEWDETETADGGWGLNGSKAPQVRAVDDCSFGGQCTEDDNAFRPITINGQNFDNIRGVRQVRATMQFFAWADKNRMPITEVTIDWGDNDEVVPQIGLYKNHRGTGECDSDPDEFGRTEDSCDERPFQLTHDYTCTDAQLADMGSCVYMDTLTGGRHVYAYSGTGVGGCRSSDNKCVYTPRVMIKDNWGWCTGTCPGNPGLDGCYDGQANTDPSSSIPTDPTNECEVEGMFAVPNPFDPDKDPWVYYDGEIIVEPAP